MEINATLRTILEIGFGLVYLIGAVFNSVYTYRHGDEFYGSFAKSAWFRPARKIIKSLVIPNSKVFTILLITFQLIVALTILSRGSLVVYGLYAGAIFSFAAVFVSSFAGAAANLILAVIQFILAFTQ